MTAKREGTYRGTVLVVDDEKDIRESLRMVLEYEGYRVREAASGDAALTEARRSSPDAILLDIKMPEMDGLEVLGSLRERGYEMPVIIVTGHGDISTAVEATRKGAFDFFEKPLQRERVLLSLGNALEHYRLQQESAVLRGQPDELIGTSTALRSLRATIAKAAPANATVLIVGESGTGKELVAKALHRQGTRSQRPWVQVNCAAIPEELIESELFGHEKGSFTGAVRKQLGKFVAADSGTIFLDEIGDMSARTQAKVLRVLQSGEVEPVGAQRVIEVDVRVIAATNRELEEEISEGRFREDLFYRLNVIPIRTPPLREHLEDIVELVEYFVRRYATVNNCQPKEFSDDALEHLRSLPWKGNVRELKNILERALILSSASTITRDELLRGVEGGPPDLKSVVASAKTLKEFREGAERVFLIEQLKRHDWNVTQTARSIATPRSNLYKKMEQYGIQREPIPDEA
jgi:two-component system nitrogen regulation response regulator NtrX